MHKFRFTIYCQRIFWISYINLNFYHSCMRMQFDLYLCSCFVYLFYILGILANFSWYHILVFLFLFFFSSKVKSLCLPLLLTAYSNLLPFYIALSFVFINSKDPLYLTLLSNLEENKYEIQVSARILIFVNFISFCIAKFSWVY